jgi:transposase-like protein
MPKKKLISRSIRNSYTAKEKLDVVTYAKKTSIRTAARKYNIDHSMVLRWKKEEEKLKTAPSKARKIGTGCHPHYPDVEIVLKQWILELRQNAFCVSANNVKTQMKYLLENEFNEKYPNSNNFLASDHWFYRFLHRHDLSLRRHTKISQKLPEDLDDKLLSFQ